MKNDSSEFRDGASRNSENKKNNLTVISRIFKQRNLAPSAGSCMQLRTYFYRTIMLCTYPQSASSAIVPMCTLFTFFNAPVPCMAVHCAMQRNSDTIFRDKQYDVLQCMAIRGRSYLKHLNSSCCNGCSNRFSNQSSSIENGGQFFIFQKKKQQSVREYYFSHLIRMVYR